MNRSFWILWFSFLVLATAVQGQSIRSSQVVREEVRGLFDKKVRNVWIILSSGKLDDMHVVDMAFGTDGHHVKGFYYLRSSGERFEIDGYERENSYTLIETNKRGKTTGYIIGQFDGTSFTGHWMNMDKKRRLSLETKLVNSFDQYQPVLCDHKVWHGYYTGKIDKTPSSIFLCKSEESIGFCCKKDNVLVFDTLATSSKNSVFTIPVTENQKAIIDLESPEYIVVEDILDYRNYLLKITSLVPFQCFEFANFTTRIETIRPVLDNKRFNAWLDDTFHHWFDHGNKKITLTQEESTNNNDRFKDIGYGWVELSYVSDVYISGHIFMQSSWKKGTEKISFIFDLKRSKLLHTADIWEDMLLTSESIDSMLNQKKDHLFCPDTKVKNWLDQQAFQHVTLRENGLSFQTTYSNIYGEYEILLTYEELKPYMKNKSFLNSF